MRKVFLLLTAFAGALSANPVMPVVYSEIQTAPDSLERIELHHYAGAEPYDLSGVSLVTDAGVAVIDSGVVLEMDSFVVIDSSNTSGVFSIGDDSDYIRLWAGFGDTFRLRYPTSLYRGLEWSWAPPSGSSSSIHQWFVWENGYWTDYYDWYIDETPTFGAPNDDTVGGITGVVYDDRLIPVPGAEVHFSGEFGGASAVTDGSGIYVLHPTGPIACQVSAQKADYLPGYYPDSVHLAANQWRDSIDILLARVGIAERVAGKVVDPGLHPHRRTLIVNADRSGIALLTVYDNLGRVKISEKAALVLGSNELTLPRLRNGVYFASCRLGERTLKTKFVVY